jgi:type III secretory pathway component EscV
MDNGTLFYIVGPVLAASAVVVSFLGLRFANFPGRFAPLVFVWFAVLVGGATTFAVLHSKDEESHHEQSVDLPKATQEAEEEEAQ